MPEFDPSVVSAVGKLRRQFPDTPFLTLGQTVLWDEPVKAVFCRILEEIAPEANIMAAVHDTDYFAKLPHLDDRTQKFRLLPHNDGDTRGLWSAAGELSCLFGSETVPTRALLTENGVAFDKVARHYPGGVDNLLNRETEAWGWRAIVHTEQRSLIAADVRLADIAPALYEQLTWGFELSRQFIADRSSGEDAAAKVEQWVREYVEANQADTLSDLYRWLTPRLWVLVRGQGACNLQTSTSLQLFRFNRQTATLPRFRFVDLFLNPDTRTIARQCYDEAVRGSGIYTLGEFGEGALPFDVVIPGRGRGTLRLHEGSLYIKTEEPITLCTGCDCGSIHQLADVLEEKFGPNVALVGKAVALISMLAHEFIFVFHERASGYTARTQTMNQAIRAAGIMLPLHPLLRLRYATWSSLADVTTTFKLPPHLATAFGAGELSAGEFTTRWEEACNEQDKIRDNFKTCQSPRDLLALLAQQEAGRWSQQLNAYTAARDTLFALRERTQVLEQEATELQQRARTAMEDAQRLEREKGEMFRATVLPLLRRISDIKEAAYQSLLAAGPDGKSLKLTKEEKTAESQRRAEEEKQLLTLRAEMEPHEAQRQSYDRRIETLRQEARSLRQVARQKTRERINLERSNEAALARQAIVEIEYQAELERLRRVRDSLTVSRGLRYTNFRPTAWWIPLVSPDGTWFQNLVHTTAARLEEL